MYFSFLISLALFPFRFDRRGRGERTEEGRIEEILFNPSRMCKLIPAPIRKKGYKGK